MQEGFLIIDSEEGELASGLEGKGRLAEPEHIVEAIEAELSKSLPLSGRYSSMRVQRTSMLILYDSLETIVQAGWEWPLLRLQEN